MIVTQLPDLAFEITIWQRIRKFFMHHGNFSVRDAFSHCQRALAKYFANQNFVRTIAGWKRLHLQHATNLVAAKDFKKQSITGYGIMTSIRLSFTRSTLTERFNGYAGDVVSQDANTLGGPIILGIRIGGNTGLV